MVSTVSVILLVVVTVLVGGAEGNESSVDNYDQALEHQGSMELVDLFRAKKRPQKCKTMNPCKKLRGKCTTKKGCDGMIKNVKKGCSPKCVCCISKTRPPPPKPKPTKPSKPESCNKDCGHWCYPCRDWPYTCSDYCNGPQQSPIDICTGSTSTVASGITFSPSYSDPIDKITITNNGHTVSVSWDSGLPPRTISGGGLYGEYTLAQFHFHWGCKNNRGSEHTVDGKSYAMELHLVHYKTSYGSLEKALAHKDGLAVLGVFYDVTVENMYLKSITDNLGPVAEAGSQKTVSFKMPVMDLIPSTRTFYRYQGSLTTPTCNEIVTWSVFTTPTYLSDKQLEAFRKLMCKGGLPLCDNYRGIQPLNGRVVMKYLP